MLSQIKKTAPLVHCMTNYVVANFTANGLLAVGASPIMADEVNEVTEIVSIAQALLINIGTVNDRTAEAMLLAGGKANELSIPIVLDPVGVGSTSYRKQLVQLLLKNIQFNLIRCNAGELAAIAGEVWQSKGVDSGTGEIDIALVAKRIALQYRCLVIVTGKSDFITNGHEGLYVSGGKEIATHITGTGCLLSAICAASLASGGATNQLQNLVTTLKDYKQAAEQSTNKVGDFALQFMNRLQELAEVER
ncbi:hydroxyethylthiazole kinase [Carnobacterium sp. 17-4]|uniref:hydroxyethylthiazole kinase n=1 Tax=Carnobacterium sp. (strain 17-4) TaxID=208596 RepID=UPI00020587B7|nr:hydroxyethylthiazole kinase [Carnobacterium sp. 17-4]AEB28769.1 hydroxyethylthiazole kinase [Carnobacterium sp. 17-4]